MVGVVVGCVVGSGTASVVQSGFSSASGLLHIWQMSGNCGVMVSSPWICIRSNLTVADPPRLSYGHPRSLSGSIQPGSVGHSMVVLSRALLHSPFFFLPIYPDKA